MEQVKNIFGYSALRATDRCIDSDRESSFAFLGKLLLRAGASFNGFFPPWGKIAGGHSMKTPVSKIGFHKGADREGTGKTECWYNTEFTNCFCSGQQSSFYPYLYHLPHDSEVHLCGFLSYLNISPHWSQKDWKRQQEGLYLHLDMHKGQDLDLFWWFWALHF